MAYFDAQIQTLAGTATDGEMDQFCTDGAKEIINILPPKLKEKCMQETTLNNSSPTLDLDANASGEILHVTRLSADSGGVRLPCREVPSAYGELTGDSSSIYYASVTDPAYWISSSSDAPMLSVNPTTTLNKTAIVYHIKYPTIDVDGDDSIDNFPNEAEYLVVLYAAIKVLQNKMNEMNTNNDITTAFTYAKAGLDQAETALDKFEAANEDSIFGDEATFLTADSQLAHVSDALIKAQNLMGPTYRFTVSLFFND